MATYNIGLFIRQIRRERGITQEQLCRGLCSISTLSKMERGQYTPPGYLFQTLMERLGNYYGRHYNVFLDNDDYELWKIKESIVTVLSKNDVVRSDELITKYSEVKSFDEGLELQFMLNCKMTNAINKIELEKSKQENINVWEISSINYDEWLVMANNAILITIPNFNENNINDYMLSFEEIRSVLNLSAAFFYNKEYAKSALLLLELKESMDKFCPDLREKARLYPVILFDIAEVMYESKRYDEAIVICELGRRFCNECFRSREIPLFMIIQCKSLIKKGDLCEGKSLIFQTYAISVTLGRKDIANTISDYCYNTLGTRPKLADIFPNTHS